MSITRALWPAAASFLMLILSGCSHLFYHPTDLMYVANPEKLESIRKEVSFTSSDGTPLAGWFLPARKTPRKGLVVQFHGNAQNMTSHFNSVYWLGDEGYDVFTFDYRGYGISEGKPSQEGLNRDALAAIAWAATQSPGTSRNVVLYGQSLGGAVLLRAFQDVPAEQRARVRAVITEGTFYSYRRMGRSMLSRSWLTFLFQPLAYVLVSDEYSPEDSVPRVSPIPLLVIHGDADPVVPYSFGEKIHAMALEPKRFLRIPGGGHLDSMEREQGKYRKALLEFIEPR